MGKSHGQDEETFSHRAGVVGAGAQIGERPPHDVLTRVPLNAGALARGLVPADGAHGRWGAWSGSAPIQKVLLDLDAKGQWVEASLGFHGQTYQWTPFEHTFSITMPGRHTLRSRALDALGQTHPDVPEWNRHGDGNNAVVTRVFHVC